MKGASNVFPNSHDFLGLTHDFWITETGKTLVTGGRHWCQGNSPAWTGIAGPNSFTFFPRQEVQTYTWTHFRIISWDEGSFTPGRTCTFLGLSLSVQWANTSLHGHSNTVTLFVYKKNSIFLKCGTHMMLVILSSHCACMFNPFPSLFFYLAYLGATPHPLAGSNPELQALQGKDYPL